MESFRRAFARVDLATTRPLVLAQMEVRYFVKRLLALEYPDVPVLSFQELPSDIRVQPVGQVPWTAGRCRTERPPSEDGMPLELIVEERGAPARTQVVATDTAFVGRREDCDVVLPYSFVSARHARLQARAGAVYVEDLGSTNGVLVNGEALAPLVPRAVSPEDVVQIEKIVIRARVAEAPSRAAEPTYHEIRIPVAAVPPPVPPALPPVPRVAPVPPPILPAVTPPVTPRVPLPAAAAPPAATAAAPPAPGRTRSW